MVLASGKTSGVDKLLAWLVGDSSPRMLDNHADCLHRMRFSRVCWIALWMVFNSVYMRISLDLPKSWSSTHSPFNTVMGWMVNGG